jgi:hypothetical protein
MFKTVTAKLGNMRKPQSFVVQLSDKGNFVVQSDKSIGQFDMNTGKGVLNTKGSYFHHLTAFLGAVPYQFPPDFVQACHAAFAMKGDLLGSSEITGPIYYGGMTEISLKPATKVAQQDPDNDYVSNPLDDTNLYSFDTVTYEPTPMRYSVYLYQNLQGDSVTDQFLLTPDNFTRYFGDLESAHRAARAEVNAEGRYLILGSDLIIGGQHYSEEFAVKDVDPDAYEAAVLDRLCYKLPYSEKYLVSGVGEMGIPRHSTRDEAWIVANMIACACGYGARKVGDNELRLSVDGHRYLATYDNAVKRLVSVKRIEE